MATAPWPTVDGCMVIRSSHHHHHILANEVTVVYILPSTRLSQMEKEILTTASWSIKQDGNDGLRTFSRRAA